MTGRARLQADTRVRVSEVFDIDSDLVVPAFSERDAHVPEVAAAIETARDLEGAAIGVGLDLSPYHGRCQAIDLDAGLGNRVFDELIALVGRRGQR